MRRMTPPSLKDRRISCLVTTTPLVSMGGSAGPSLAWLTRTGVAFSAGGASFALHPVRAAATSTRNTSSASNSERFWGLSGVMANTLDLPNGQRQNAGRGGVVELGLAREQF